MNGVTSASIERRVSVGRVPNRSVSSMVLSYFVAEVGVTGLVGKWR